MDIISASESMTEAPLFIAEDIHNEGGSITLRKGTVMLGAVLCVMIVINLIISLSLGNNPLMGTILLIIVWGIFAAEGILQTKSGNKTKYNIYYFYEDRYENADRLSRTAVPYELMVKAVETGAGFYLFMEPDRAHFVAKSALTKGTAEELSGFLKLKVAEYKQRTGRGVI